jgi:hypothetical protein
VARVISPDQATTPPGGEISRISRRREAELIRLGELRGEKTREAGRGRHRGGAVRQSTERRQGTGAEERVGRWRKEGGGQMLKPRHEPRVSDKDWATVACLASNLHKHPRISSQGFA